MDYPAAGCVVKWVTKLSATSRVTLKLIWKECFLLVKYVVNNVRLEVIYLLIGAENTIQIKIKNTK